MRFINIILSRILSSFFLLLCVIVLNFILIHLAPGDPVQTLVGEMGGATEEVIKQIKIDYGLDKSLLEQLTNYVRRVANGNLGMSFHFNEPVTDLILQRLPATILLVLTALLISVFVGTLLGIFAAQKPHGWLSHFVTVLSLSGYSAPVFWTGIMLLILFSYHFPIFPCFGIRTIGVKGTITDYALDIIKHLVLPVITLASVYLAHYSRIARASMLDVLGSDYIRTARSKGLSEGIVVYKHALKNAVLPVVTLIGLQFRFLIAGAIVVETVFSWPGMGLLAFESILRRDHPLLLGILMFSTFIVVIANIVTDLSYRLLDPRIK